MRMIFVGFMIALFITSVCEAKIPPKTAEFLQGIGVDPTSPGVKAIENDVVSNSEVHGVTLNSLADQHNKNGVKQFIVTRNFIRKFMADNNISFPNDSDYRVNYLTDPEQQFITYAIKKEFGVPLTASEQQFMADQIKKEFGGVSGSK